MAKVASINRNEKRRKLTKRDLTKRTKLKEGIMNRDLPVEERFAMTLELAAMPRNGAKVRVRNRCALTGRPRSYHRKFSICRIALRKLASEGQLPGVVKSSW
ncbi:MAG: 30S ribosomal protein S14 [Alphaproteobacteria bacterium]|jgi:small subunit ribosomal protein S14|nr:30S ribosomal protein S14 [Alphaproteobacteria bacterium]MBP9049623.1 30S ribosomal protein S14 [Alphaproteobacteria bacterium]MBP9867381.1 30S ribosomal protein S14 [Alphaproteobacteria bacterium]